MSEKQDLYQGLADFLRLGSPSGLGAVFQPGFDPAIAAIYRNGFYRSCREALGSTFVSVHHWLGDDEFAALARAYIDQNPPQVGSLTGYGANFPGWISGQLDPSQKWLVDMAQLDWGWLACLQGVDDVPLVPQTVQALAKGGAELTRLPIGLLSNARLVDAESTVFPIWSTFKSGNSSHDLSTVVESVPQGILLWRPAMDVHARVLSTAEWLFLNELKWKQNLGAAGARVLESKPNFDLAGLFAQLLANGVLRLTGEES